ncbi:MAG: cell division protein FtsQ/DivIB [Candidatus Omnitrophica bacterium]|nr:cell division protein FtsQ/DivIB [Candidatus Omnitrophota bacterium]
MKRQLLYLLVQLTIFAIVSSALFFLTSEVLKSEYFKIKSVLSKQDEIDLSYLKGRNIFDIDLERESQYLIHLYPKYKKVKLIRILPSYLFVDFVRRNPIAYVKLNRYMCVDEDGFFFEMPDNAQDIDIPVISGLERRISRSEPDRRYDVKELMAGLDIIREIKKNASLKEYKLKKVNVDNLNNLSFFLVLPLPSPKRDTQPEVMEFEVKIGYEAVKDKISILANILTQIKDELPSIRYIDLRFKDPTVKFKNPKDKT